MNAKQDTTEPGGFYDMTGDKPREVSAEEALGDDRAFGEELQEIAKEHAADMAKLESKDKATRERGLYGGSVEEVSRAIAAEQGLEMAPNARIRRELETELNEHQLSERGQEMASRVMERSKIEAAKKSANTHYNAQIKDLDEQIAALAEPIDRGSDLVLVDCVQLADFATNSVRVYRLDTREHIETRPMTAAEREKLAQRDLPLDADTEEDGDDPPELTPGEWPASLKPEPEALPGTGTVTRAAAEGAEFDGEHWMLTEVDNDGNGTTASSRKRYASYVVSDPEDETGRKRYAFVPWPQAEEG